METGEPMKQTENQNNTTTNLINKWEKLETICLGESHFYQQEKPLYILGMEREIKIQRDRDRQTEIE